MTAFLFGPQISLRNENNINGHATGFVEAFDKHWNVVLSDVVHVWKRKKPHFCPAAASLAGTEDEEELDICTAKLKALGIAIPPLAVKSINRKFAECKRHIGQIVIRGEQIALISLADVSPESASATSLFNADNKTATKKQ